MTIESLLEQQKKIQASLEQMLSFTAVFGEWTSRDMIEHMIQITELEKQNTGRKSLVMSYIKNR